MALLGKTLKGRSTRLAQGEGVRVRRIHRLKEQAKTMEEIDNEKKLAKIKKDHLKAAWLEEANMSHQNRKKILTNWRKLMRVAKSEQLKSEIRVQAQNHEREVDAKDAVLQMLDRDLDESEEQQQTSLRQYFIHVDDLWALQESRLRGLAEEFERDVQLLQQEFSKEKEQVMTRHLLEKRELEDIMAAVESEEAERESEDHHEHENYREMIKNRNMEDVNHMRMNLLGQTVDLETKFDKQFNRQTQETQMKTEKYSEQIDKDEIDSIKIRKQVRNIDKLNQQIKTLKLKIAQNGTECKERNIVLKDEYDRIRKHQNELKNRMVQLRDDQNKRLTSLSTNAKSCMNKLSADKDLLEKILRTAELCRRQETEKEKVLPFYEQDPEGEDNVNIEGPLSQDEIEDLTHLGKFFQRQNKVLLDKLAIEKQKMTLHKENLFFKSLLKQYLDGVSVNEDVMSSANPLLVVNNKVNLNHPVEKAEKVDKPCIEAAHAVKNMKVKI